MIPLTMQNLSYCMLHSKRNYNGYDTTNYAEPSLLHAGADICFLCLWSPICQLSCSKGYAIRSLSLFLLSQTSDRRFDVAASEQ